MIAAVLAGLATGYSIAIPVGPMTAYLISLAARTTVRVGAAAALGVAIVDGGYALAAVLGGAAAGEAVRPVLGVLHRVSVAVLAGVAARAIRSGVAGSGPAAVSPGAQPELSPLRAFALLAGLTAVNPTTLIYFVALVVGLRAGTAPVADRAVFVAATFAASASWQLVLACGGGLFGRLLTGETGRRWTAIGSGTLIGLLALRLAMG